jgi:hypothetical protein
MPSTLGIVSSQRSSLPLDPSTIPNLAAWYDANDASTFTLTGALVEQWRDKSGNNRHLVPRVSGDRPSRSGVSDSGKTSLVYVDGNKLRTPAGSTSIGAASSAVTMITAFKSAGASPSYDEIPCSLTSSNAGAPLAGWGTNRYFGASGGGAAFAVTNMMRASTVLTAFLYNQDANTPRLDEYVNGQLFQTVTWPFSPWITASQVIGLGGRDDGATGFVGQMMEAVIYDRKLTTVEQQQVEAYLHTKWNAWTAAVPVTKDLVAWYDADHTPSFTFASGALVQNWADRSKAGNHLTRKSAGSEPSRSGTQNGHVTVVFAGAKYMEQAASMPKPGQLYECSWFVVFKKTGANNTYESFPLTYTSFDLWGTNLTIAGTGASSRSVTAATAWELWTMQAGSTVSAPSNLTFRQFLNGTQVGSDTVNASGAVWGGGIGMGRIDIATRSDNVTQFSGEVGEMIVYNRMLTVADRQSVETYLKTKWGTP